MKYFFCLILSLIITSQVNAQKLNKSNHNNQDSTLHIKKGDSTTTILNHLSKNKFWKIHGTNSLSINQTAFSNWLLGGSNNLTVDIRLNYDFNYENPNWSLDNKVLLTYGFNKQKAHTIKKTDDRIEITSILGKKTSTKWNYSGYLNFKTQFDKGLDPADPNNKISHFLSPVFLQFGPGVFWKKNDDFKFNISPLAPRFIFVHSEFTKKGKSYGVSKDQVKLFEFGISTYGYYKFHIMKNVTMENILLAYWNYFNNTKGVDFDYQANISMKVNKFISASIYYEALYDFESLQELQQKESIGIGFKYSL